MSSPTSHLLHQKSMSTFLHFPTLFWFPTFLCLCSLPSSSLPPQDPRVAFFEASVHRPLTSVQGFGQLPPSYLIPVSHQKAARQLLLSL